MSKRKIIVISSTVAIILLALLAIFIIQKSVTGGGTTEPTPTVTAEPTTNPGELPPATDGSIGYDLDEFKNTEQYEAGTTSMLGEFTDTIDVGELDLAYSILARNTMERYVENSVANPYFVSNLWGTADDYRKDSLQTYLTPLMSDELTEEFLTASSDPEAEEFEAYYSQLLHLPSEGLEPSLYCAETFAEEACFYYPYEYTGFTLAPVEGSDQQVQGTLTVKVQPIYQKPDSLEGNTVYEDRTYTFNFVLQLNDEETAGGLDEKPILEIAALDGSLVIGQVTDYLVMETDVE